MQCRLGVVIPLVLCAVGLASADIYKCEVNGQVVFRNSPCSPEDPTPPYVTHQEAPAPSSTIAPPAAPVVVAPRPHASPTLAPSTPAPTTPATPTPRQTPVDTTELALTERGQSMATVRHRLGAPARVVSQPPLIRAESNRSGAPAVRIERERWVYPGNSLVGTAYVQFHNGSVVSAERKR